MNQKLKTILIAAAILLVGLWALSKVPFNKDITQEISAIIYENGTPTGTTAVYMNGEISNYFFAYKDEFNGVFHIQSYEKTGKGGISANIQWGYKQNIQHLTYSQNATFPDMDIINWILINEEMTQFALMLIDGTIIATSDEIYKLYSEHVS